MFDRKSIRTHHEAINALIAKYCEENGLAFNPTSVSFTSTELNYKCNIRATDEAGNVTLDPWDKMAIASLIENAPAEVKNAPTVIGRTVHLYNGRTATILAYNRRRPKYCWTIRVNGATKVCGNNVILWNKGFAA